MSLIFFTGFDLTDNVNQLPFMDGVTSVGLVGSGQGRYGYGRALNFYNPNSSKIDLKAAYSELFFEFDMQMNNADTGGTPGGGIFHVADEDGNPQIYLCNISSSGNYVNWQFRDGGGTLIGDPTTGYPIPWDNSWFHVGIRIKIHATAGEVELRIDTGAGVSVEILSTGLDTEYQVGKGMQYFGLRRPLFGGNFIMDNAIVMDTAGAEHNTFKGPGRVYYQMPTADGNYGQFTPSSGDNYTNVDEVPPNEDSDYNQSSTAGHRDSFTVPTWATLLDAGLDIAAAKATALARKTDATNIDLFTFLRTGSTDYDGSAVSLGESYTSLADLNCPETVWPEDPSDSNPWTITKLNACEWGYGIPT